MEVFDSGSGGTTGLHHRSPSWRAASVVTSNSTAMLRIDRLWSGGALLHRPHLPRGVLSLHCVPGQRQHPQAPPHPAQRQRFRGAAGSSSTRACPPTSRHEIATLLLPIIAKACLACVPAGGPSSLTGLADASRIGVGLGLHTYLWSCAILAGANIGFMPAGNIRGQVLAG